MAAYTYRFSQIDLSGHGPFETEQRITIPAGRTYICGEHGVGKSTVARCLRRAFERGEGGAGVAAHAPALASLVFLDQGTLLPYAGNTGVTLTDALAAIRAVGESGPFERELTRGVQRLLQDKIASGSKFSGTVADAEALQARFSDAGCMVVNSRTGECLNGLFQAVGERVVLYLAANSALRKCLQLDLPFVWDSWLESLDGAILNASLRFLPEFTQQSIVCAREGTLERAGARASFRIQQRPGGGKSFIERIV